MIDVTLIQFPELDQRAVETWRKKKAWSSGIGCSVNFWAVCLTSDQNCSILGQVQKIWSNAGDARSIGAQQSKVVGKFFCNFAGVLYHLVKILKLVSCVFVQMDDWYVNRRMHCFCCGPNGQFRSRSHSLMQRRE